MSLVFGSCCREVSVGPTLAFDHLSPSPAYVTPLVRDPPTPDEQPQREETAILSHAGDPALGNLLPAKDDDGGRGGGGGDDQGSGTAKAEMFEIGESGSGKRVEASSESSSIGVPGDSNADGLSDGDGDEVQSKFSRCFGSLGSLEESLPIKRGLSNHFSGKSKSFANLAEVSRVEDLAKPENPFNKRRRTLLAIKHWSSRNYKSSSSSSSSSSNGFYCSPNPTSMPLLQAFDEQEEEEEDEAADDDDDNDDEGKQQEEAERRHHHHEKRKLRIGLKSQYQSCFSLTDLQHA
ncbi:protein OXIDATIVE STRESS 3 LIKE 5 [Malania oleifera]|uniref:protein OXIDATIVE STRESS 3 LIKE 5 n=1 Tax=Malania oleifera TaxID=397392 RepID=UPI0025ADC863|nr:protein OXIDATIVE STRESS 3 LIKE 5 [Malania oleifera]